MKKITIKREAAIKRFTKDKQIICVSGAFFGDEAKGKMVAELSNFVNAIARVNSGENAGHTIYVNKKKYVFHLVPSGTLTGKLTFIGANCVMDPINFYNKEIASLNEANFDYSNLIIGNVYVVHPLHKMIDIARNPNDSTGKGMSAVHQDIKGKRAIRIEDFLNGNLDKLEKSIDFWTNQLKELGYNKNKILKILEKNEKVPKHVKKFFSKKNTKSMMDYLNKEINNLIKSGKFPKIGNPKAEMLKILENGGKILLEGSQSFFLSNGEGTHYKSSTSAETDTIGVLASSGLPSKFKSTTINILKLPSSRVGNGANPSGYVEQGWFSKRELQKEKLDTVNIDFNLAYQQFLKAINKNGFFINRKYKCLNNKEVELNGEKLMLNEALAISSCLKYGEFGATTGKPRVCGSLDLLHIAHVVKYQGGVFSVSCMDRLDGLEKVPVVIGYKYEGSQKQSNGIVFKKGDLIKIKEELPNEEILKNCKPIYKILNGWKSSNIDSKGDLDKNLINFLNFIEKETGANIISFGNGENTEDIIYLNKK